MKTSNYVCLFILITADHYSGNPGFSTRFVYGLFPGGESDTDLGQIGSYILSLDSATATVARPADEVSLDFIVSAMPYRFLLTYTPETTVTRTTGLHTGSVELTSNNDISLFLYGSSPPVRA